MDNPNNTVWDWFTTKLGKTTASLILMLAVSKGMGKVGALLLNTAAKPKMAAIAAGTLLTIFGLPATAMKHSHVILRGKSMNSQLTAILLVASIYSTVSTSREAEKSRYKRGGSQ